MADKVKRLNYFNGQFLNAKDFTDEQTYQSHLRQEHNRLLHTWGIADGLMLSADKGAMQVKVSPGLGIDIHGREIVLADEVLTDDLTTFAGKSPLYITIEWNEVESDKSTVAGVDSATRMELKPIIKVVTTQPAAGEALILGTVSVNTDGRVQDYENSPALRRMAGARGGDLSVVSLNLSGLNIAPDMQPRMTVTTAGRIDLQGSLQINGNLGVTGNVGIGTTSPNRLLQLTKSASGALGPELVLQNSASFATGNAAQIAFQTDGTTGAGVYNAAIKAVQDGLGSGGSTALTFGTYGGGGTPDERMRITSTGNVGIGTTAPGVKLEVNGALKFTNTGSDANDGRIGSALFTPGLNLVGIKTDTSYRRIAIWGAVTQMENNGTNTWAGINQFNGNIGIGGNLTMTGNVGIGTTSPNRLLQLTKSASGALGPELVLQNSASFATGNAAQIAFQTDGTTGAGVYNAAIKAVQDGLGSGGYTALTFGTYGGGGTPDERMRITSAGKVGIGTAAPAASLDIGGNAAHNVQAIFTRGQDANFQLYAANGASNENGAVQATFGLGYAGTGDAATLSFIRGGGALDAALAFNTHGKERLRITGAGTFVSPMWRVTQVMNQVRGPLPKGDKFTSGGGTLMIIFSGSGRSGSVQTTVGMNLQLDGTVAGSARTHANEKDSHKAFTTSILVKTDVAAGTHSIDLVALSGTVTDDNDYFSVTVLEQPF